MGQKQERERVTKEGWGKEGGKSGSTAWQIIPALAAKALFRPERESSKTRQEEGARDSLFLAT